MPWNWSRQTPNPRTSSSSVSRPGFEPPLQRLVRLVAEEPGVHAFIHRATADQGVVEEARSMTRTLLQGQMLTAQCVEFCRRYGVPEPLLRARLWAVASLFPGQSLPGGDPYEILGVEPTADTDTVKSAFRRLCLQCHPDLNQDDPKAATRFQQLKAAYDMVSDQSATVGFGPGEGAAVWEEPPCDEPRPSAWRRMRHLLPLGLVVAFLVLAVSFADLLVQRPRSRSLSRDAASVTGSGNQALSAADTGVREPLSLNSSSAPGGDATADGKGAARIAQDAGVMKRSHESGARPDALLDAHAHGAEPGVRPAAVTVSSAADSSAPPGGPGLAAALEREPLRSVRIKPASPVGTDVDAVSGRQAHSASTGQGASPLESRSGDGPSQPESQDVARVSKPLSKSLPDVAPVIEAPRPKASAQPDPHSSAEAPKSQGVAQLDTPSVAGISNRQNTVQSDSQPPAESPKPRREARDAAGPAARRVGEATDGRTDDAWESQKNAEASAGRVPLTPDTPASEPDSLEKKRRPTGNVASSPDASEKPLKKSLSRPDSLVAAAPVVDVAVVEARLMGFLDTYASDYSKRDLFAFMAHFTPQARENSKPVKSLLSAYQKNFREISVADYRIDVERWTIHDDGVLFEGRFHLLGSYADGRSIASRGSLSMDLVPSGETYRVRNLVYSFR